MVYYEQPSLELLGVPVLWLPWLVLPADGDFEMPVLSYDQNYGVGMSFPFFRYQVAGGTVLLTPTLFSKQGVMLGAEWRQRVGDLQYNVRGSAIYQLDPSVYKALRMGLARIRADDGHVHPTDEWTLAGPIRLHRSGLSARLPDRDSTVRNEVYATYLNDATLPIRDPAVRSGR